jgi:hypothetical protein
MTRKVCEKRGPLIGIMTLVIGFAVFYLVIGGLGIRPSLLECVIGAIGILGLIAASYFLFRTKHAFLFIILGMLFTLGGIAVVRIMWPLYPQIASILYPFCVSLALVFFVLSTIKMGKEFIEKVKK